MASATPVSTPLLDVQALLETGEDEPADVPYRSAVGSLQYLACCTRPDLLFAVNILARFNSCPERKHWSAVKRVLQYLKGTIDQGIVYTSAEGHAVRAYSDAVWGNSVVDRRSISGTLVIYGGGPVVFSSRRQSVVAQSTTESEYVAANEVVKEVRALKEFTDELGVEVETPSVLIDNQSAVAQIQNLDTKRRSKHITVKYHYVREEFQSGSFTVSYIQTDNQIADYFTKPLSGPRLSKLREMSGLRR